MREFGAEKGGELKFVTFVPGSNGPGTFLFKLREMLTGNHVCCRTHKLAPISWRFASRNSCLHKKKKKLARGKSV